MREPSHADAVEFLVRASTYDDAAALERHFTRVLARFGIETFACSRQDARAFGESPLVLARRGSNGWDQYMQDQGYVSINPCIRWSAAGRRVFSWREVQAESHRSGEISLKERALWADAAKNDMRDGLTVTTLGPGGQVLATRMITGEARIRASDRPVLEALAIVFSTLRYRLHERAMDMPLNAVLTRREAECLRWAAQGLHDYDIADRMGISANTVGNHMQNAMRKLAAPSRLAAFYRALSLGALD